VRRHFSYEPGEKVVRNRVFSKFTDVMRARRHRVADFYFSLRRLEPRARLQQISSLAHRFVVEVGTHPVNSEEYRFLTGGEVFRWAGDSAIAPRFAAKVK
jgi:hypothetical protein